MKGEVKYKGVVYIVEQHNDDQPMCPGHSAMESVEPFVQDMGNGMGAVTNPVEFMKALLGALESQEQDRGVTILDVIFGQGRWHKIQCKKNDETGLCSAVIGVEASVYPRPHPSADVTKIGEMVVLPDHEASQFDFVDEPIAISLN